MIAELFKKLRAYQETNISALEANTGVRMFLGNVDPIKILLASQLGMKKLTEQIDRSANVGIGYASSVNHLKEDLEAIKNNS